MRTIMGKVLQAITGSTKRIVGIMAHDFQRVFTNPVAAIIAVGVMVLPSLYAWFNIQASWDPYGSTDHISVAVSNVDEGTVVQGMELNVGKSIVESLAENEQIGWKFVNKEKALAGVRSGKYYAAVVIPEDFSKNMTSVLTPDIERPKIEYYVNEKKNAIAPKITDKGVGVIQQMVNKTFISESVTVIGDVVLGMSEKDKALNRKLVQDISLDKEKEQVDTAIESLQDLEEGMDNLTDTVEAFQATMDALEELSKTINTSFGILKDSVKEVQDQSSNTIQMDALKNLASDTPDSIGNTIGAITTSLNSIYQSLDSIERLVQGNNPAEAIPTLNATKTQLQELVNTNNELIDILKNNTIFYQTPVGSDCVARLEHANSSLNGGIETLDKIIENLQTSTSRDDALKEISQLKETVTTCKEQIADIGTQIETTMNEQVSAAADEAVGNVDAVRKAAESFGGAVPSAQATMDSVSKAMSSLGTSLTSMTKVLQGSKDAIGKGITELEGMKEILEEIEKQKNMNISQAIQNFVLEKFGVDLNDYKNSPETIGEFLSAPVELETHKIFPVANYGSALAPFYSILAMWVGGLILVSIFKCRASTNKYLDISQYRPFELYIGRYLIFMNFGIIQSVIICLGDLYLLKIQCLYPGRFIFVGVVAGIVFSNIIYTLTITFDDVGKAIAVIMLVLQVAGAGGTFPIEVTPGFFNMINPFLPFTHGMNAMRDAVAGLYGHNYAISLLKLFVYFPIFYIFGTVFRTPLIKLNEFFAGHVENTGIM